METSRLPKFQERFKELRGDMPQGEFCKKIRISRPTVSLYENGERIPDAEVLRNIAEYCNVSADWLLGLSDIQTANEDMKTAQRVTGLSEKAIENAKSLDDITLLTRLLEDDAFIKLLDDITVFENRVSACKREYGDIHSKESEAENDSLPEALSIADMENPAIAAALTRSTNLSYSTWHFSVEYAKMRLSAIDIEHDFSSVLTRIADADRIIADGNELTKGRIDNG